MGLGLAVRCCLLHPVQGLKCERPVCCGVGAGSRAQASDALELPSGPWLLCSIQGEVKINFLIVSIDISSVVHLLHF